MHYDFMARVWRVYYITDAQRFVRSAIYLNRCTHSVYVHVCVRT